MKRFLLLLLALVGLLLISSCVPQPEDIIVCQETEYDDDILETYPGEMPEGEIVYRKPVIYLYPTEETVVSVKLNLNGSLTHTYPLYNDGWTVTASPDGTLTDDSGREYYCLFWEGEQDVEYDMTSGFVVPGSGTVAFLEEALNKLGLTDKEANEFIIYWAPQMESNPYNLISFATEQYIANASLQVTPTPDTIIRVFMTWKKLDAPINVTPHELSSPERTGFTVVEWGGCEVK